MEELDSQLMIGWLWFDFDGRWNRTRRLTIAQVLSLEVIGNEYMLSDFVSTAFD